MAVGFTGTGVALVTPFKNDQSVDFEGLERVVRHVLDGGVEYLVVLGTTGEPATLTPGEKIEIVKSVIRINSKRVPIVIGVGGNNTYETVEKIRQTDFSGIDGLLSVSPYYNKPAQEGIFLHFSAIAEASPVPVILYNVPGRTASNISAETIIRLAEKYRKIVGVKEASGNFQQIMQILRDKPDHFQVISGDDALALPMIMMGGTGVISVIANSHPAAYSSMVRAALKGDREANHMHFGMLDVISAIFEECSPSGVKSALKHLGICDDFVRLPLVPVSEALNNRIGKLFKTLL
jgi:4-hydroxy-tetrahydrodipicolinate synthase